MNLPVYNCLIDENPNDESGIYAISFVDEPANDTAFVALKKQPCEEHLSLDRKKQILTGVVLRPEQLIYRNSAQMGEHYIKFSAEQIEKISHKMMRTSLALHNTTHQHQQPLEGNYLIELWIVEDPQNDKSNALGFRNLPKGTLMCSYKVEDKAYWETQVLAGHVKGFSLEGFFFQQEMKRHDKSNINKLMNMNRKNKSTLLSKIARFFLDIEAVQSADATQSGPAYVTFRLADGKEALADADGFVTLDGEQMPAGEHRLADGNILTVDEQGQFTGTKEPSVQNTTPEAATAPQVLRNKDKRLDMTGEAVAPARNMDELSAKVAEMEAAIADMKKLMEEMLKKTNVAKAEVETLRKSTASSSPLTQAHRNAAHRNATHTERMAASLALQVQRQK